jgi:diguanylate cyclase (GGDEF)-like protein
MRFNILIAVCQNDPLTTCKSYIDEEIKNVDINYLSSSEDIVNHIKNLDLIIVDEKFEHNKNIIDRCLQNNIYIIYLTNSNIQVDNFYTDKRIELLFKPIDIDMLVHKIEQYISIILKDIALEQEKELSNSIINNITNPIFSFNDDEIVFANDFFYKLTACKSLREINEKYGKIINMFIPERNCCTIFDKNWLDTINKNNLHVCILDNNNLKKYFTVQKIYLAHNDTNIILLNDVSYERKHKDELYNLLYNDNLTGLPNKAKLIEELQNNRNLRLTSICIIDINSFKEINDFYGHKIGDSILIELGNIIKKSIIEIKGLKFYKFPSDTYCITNILDNKDEFIALIERIVESAYKKVFVFDQYEIDIRITAGLSFSNKNNKLITADIALEAAKKDHKDYMVFYDELDKFQEYENNMLWTKKLKSAFVKDNIEVYFQPLVNNKTLLVDKYECLVRLIDEDGKVVVPFFFLDISKKSNQYKKLTKIVLEKSFKKFVNLPFEFSVNISYEDIEDIEFLDFVKGLLNKYDVAQRVVFEILEDENVKNYNLLISFIDEVKSLGCKVAIDDFGSGYSNFEHLLKMNVDYLKIDASLIKNIATDENSYKITKTIVDFAKSLNMKTIAEFVENKEIFELTKVLGVDFSQGYYFSAPIANPDLIDFKTGDDNE